jgi:hypothetical protein
LDAGANGRMKAQVEAVVRLVEGRKKCRVVSCATEFSVDRQGRTWLLRTVACVTAVDGPAVARRGGGELKAARAAASSSVGQALTSAAASGSEELATEAGGAAGGRRKHGVYGAAGGGNTEERALRRRARAGVPDEAAVQRVLAELDASAQRSHLLRSGPGQEAPCEAHEATSTLEVRQLASSAAASKALGSTQLSGCPGDFCSKFGARRATLEHSRRAF